MSKNIWGAHIGLEGFEMTAGQKSWVDRGVGVGLGRVGSRGEYDQKHIE